MMFFMFNRDWVKAKMKRHSGSHIAEKGLLKSDPEKQSVQEKRNLDNTPFVGNTMSDPSFFERFKEKPVRTYAKLAFLPGFIPRIKQIGHQFGHFAYMLAQVYGAVRLIPAGHPVLNPANIGKFGFRDVIKAASNNLVFTRSNVDQIAVFFAVIAALVILAGQFLMVGFIAMTGTAFATTTLSPTMGFFSTPNPDQDVVFRFLEQVFGDMDIFTTDAVATVGAVGNPVHAGLHAMMGFFSMAMMVVAVFIVLYYVITVVAEAAASGSPFGRRFNSVWAPLRLVVALGLLVPLGNHMNSAQYITLYVAKAGSGMATQAWILFANELANGSSTFVVKPDMYGTRALVTNMFMAEVCATAINAVKNNNDVEAAVIVERTNSVPYTSKTFAQARLDAINYNASHWRDSNSADMIWTSEAGERNPENICGSVSLPLQTQIAETLIDGLPNYVDWAKYSDAIPAITATIEAQIAAQVDVIMNAIQGDVTLSYDGGSATVSLAEAIVAYEVDNATINGITFDSAQRASMDISFVTDNLKAVMETTNEAIVTTINNAFTQMLALDANNIAKQLSAKGWGYSGLIYPQIGTINERLRQTAENMPDGALNFSTYMVLDKINTETTTYNQGKRKYNEASQKLRSLGINNNSRNDIAGAINKAAELSEKVGPLTAPANQTIDEETLEAPLDEEDEAGAFERFLNWVFGIQDLAELRRDASLDPMVSLQEAGDHMLSSSLYALAASGIGTVASSFATKIKIPFVGDLIAGLTGGLAKLAAIIATIGIITGIVLYYYIPMLPFIYFFFAIVGWVMEIFEAMVAMPLWALGHLRIDGDGLPGSGGGAGYALLFAIFTRPFFIVTGLIGGYIIFGASVYLLQELYAELLNIIRPDGIGGFGNFVYTIIYVFIIYQLAMMCFKMVDSVPGQIMRWMGQGVQTFNDSRGDPVGNTASYLLGGAAVVSQFTGFATSQADSVRGYVKGKEAEADANTKHQQMIDAMGGGRDRGGDGGGGAA